jgi:hypothetical protein
MIQINKFMGHSHLFFKKTRFLVREPTSIGPSPILWEHCTPLNSSTSLDPSCKIDTNMLSLLSLLFQFTHMRVELWANYALHQPTFSVYIHESWTLGKAYGIKLRCDCKHLGEQFENLRNLLRTWWEHIGNGAKTKIENLHPPHPTPKGKN